MLTSATLTTVSKSRPVTLVNLSATGARLRGDRLPDCGGTLILRTESIEAFATVQWRSGDLCGVEFEVPLRDEDVALLRAESSVGTLTSLTAEERLALQDWNSGFAR